MDLIKPGRIIDFMGMRRWWLVFSVSLMLASAVLLVHPGPKYGIDFLGGTEVTLHFERTVDPAALRAALTHLGHPNAEVVPSRTPNTFIVRVERTSSITPEQERRMRDNVRTALGDSMQLTEFRVSPGGDHVVLQLSGNKTDVEVAQLMESAGANVRGDRAVRVGQAEEHRWQVPLVSIGDQITSGVTRELNNEASLQASVWVSPRAGKELRDQAIRAVLYSIVFIMIYVAFRFDLRFAPGGILALFHDAIVTLGFFCLTRKEVTISTVAAILTVVGYSMNDTIIVYDRIRENLAKRRGLRLLDVINVSVSEMFSRTIITSFTVILSVAPFTIWGHGVIRDFAWAMIIGVLAGTYSSIYVAAPLTEWIDTRYFHPGGGVSASLPASSAAASKSASATAAKKDDAQTAAAPSATSARKQPKATSKRPPAAAEASEAQAENKREEPEGEAGAGGDETEESGS
jgi:preprotein translocase subunit SecF